MKVIILKLENEEEESRFKEFLETITNKVEEVETKVTSDIQELTIELDKSRMRNVTNVLSKIGVKSNLKGYGYIRDATIIYLEDANLFSLGVTKHLYPYLAKKYETSPEKIERAIRNAIENVWKNGDKEFLKKMFPYNQTHRPTNNEFLSKIVDEIRLAELEQQNK